MAERAWKISICKKPRPLGRNSCSKKKIKEFDIGDQNMGKHWVFEYPRISFSVLGIAMFV